MDANEVRTKMKRRSRTNFALLSFFFFFSSQIPTATVTEYLLEPPAAKKDEHAVIFCLGMLKFKSLITSHLIFFYCYLFIIFNRFNYADVSGSMDGSRIGTLKSSLDEQLHQLSQTMPDTRVGMTLLLSPVVCPLIYNFFCRTHYIQQRCHLLQWC